MRRLHAHDVPSIRSAVLHPFPAVVGCYGWLSCMPVARHRSLLVGLSGLGFAEASCCMKHLATGSNKGVYEFALRRVARCALGVVVAAPD